VFVNIVYRRCSQTSFAKNVQSILFGYIVRLALYPTLDTFHAATFKLVKFLENNHIRIIFKGNKY
jgi:hypothetical protein